MKLVKNHSDDFLGISRFCIQLNHLYRKIGFISVLTHVMRISLAFILMICYIFCCYCRIAETIVRDRRFSH